jgi:ATP-dependent protease ClpP protease subunit
MNTNELLNAMKKRIDAILAGGAASQHTKLWIKGDYGRVYITGGSGSRKYQAWVDSRGQADAFDAYWRTFGITKGILENIYSEVSKQ